MCDTLENVRPVGHQNRWNVQQVREHQRARVVDETNGHVELEGTQLFE